MWAFGGPVAWLEEFPPTPAQGPGIVLFAEVFGINEHLLETAIRLASGGRSVVAVNVFHRSTSASVSYDQPELALQRSQSLRREEIEQDIAACVALLRSKGITEPFAAVGLRFGGRLALLASAWRGNDFDRVVAVYPVGIMGDDRLPMLAAGLAEEVKSIRAKLLMLFGTADPLVSATERCTIEKTLEENSVPHGIVTVDAADKFLNRFSANYRREAADFAWREIEQFLAMTIVRSGMGE